MATEEDRKHAVDEKNGHGEIEATTEDIFTEDALDPIYQQKARVLNDATQEIGMGRYQWALFVVTGFGWLVDNLWPIVTGLILPPVLNEFNFDGPFLKLGQNIGLLVGAAFWGIGSDIWGRRVSFNITLLITGVFALAGGASPNYVALCSFAAVWSVGVGGNLPVDSAIFLEFLPASHQYLLTVLSIWWAFGQLLGSLVAWPLIGNYSCSTPTPPALCTRDSNQGWRYFLYTMGGLMMILWAIRFFLFKLYESPKYLMGKGQEEKAVEVVHQVATYNGKTSHLSLENLTTIGSMEEKNVGGGAALRRHLAKFDSNHVKSLFATRKLAWSTSLLIALWALIGLAFPLYNSFVTYFLATRGADFGDGSVYITYRNVSAGSFIVQEKGYRLIGGIRTLSGAVASDSEHYWGSGSPTGRIHGRVADLGTTRKSVYIDA
ncbi:hypothetical protein V5O48_004613 [Marasmius crinis-equi]|uniref:Major facilitator superfamily (MFS) profile domain-containing protein n=1 Tax=Marasmius crinis-equi TaxID=585013 RepID=A0ABR3FPX8_9AGAR